MVEGEGAGGARGGCAGLLESLPSLVAANGPAPGSAIHSYQFASCCIFFSLVFHSLTHAILLFKLLKKRQRPFFPEIHCRGLREWGGKERKKKKKYIQHRQEMANTSGQPATQLRAGKKKKKEKKKKFRWKVWESEGESENSDAELTAHLSRWFE